MLSETKDVVEQRQSVSAVPCSHPRPTGLWLWSDGCRFKPLSFEVVNYAAKSNLSSFARWQRKEQVWVETCICLITELGHFLLCVVSSRALRLMLQFLSGLLLNLSQLNFWEHRKGTGMGVHYKKKLNDRQVLRLIPGQPVHCSFLYSLRCNLVAKAKFQKTRPSQVFIPAAPTSQLFKWDHIFPLSLFFP